MLNWIIWNKTVLTLTLCITNLAVKKETEIFWVTGTNFGTEKVAYIYVNVMC